MTHPLFFISITAPSSRFYSLPPNKIKHYYSVAANKNTSLLENLCTITLYKKYSKSLYYYNRNIEVDFYVPDEGLAVQASYQMSDEETIEREVKALVTLHGLYPLKRAMIITYEDEGEIVRDGLKIEIRPAWKWVLEG